MGRNTCLSIWHVHLVSSTTISPCYVHSCVQQKVSAFMYYRFCGLFERHMNFCASHIYCAWWFLCSDSSIKVSPDSIWDLGSLTKVIIWPFSQPLVVSHQGVFIRFRIAFIILASLQKISSVPPQKLQIQKRTCKYVNLHAFWSTNKSCQFEQNSEFAQNM